MKFRVAIFCFDEMEVLDFAGPFEVFSVANEISNYQLLDIVLVGYKSLHISCRNGLNISCNRIWHPDDVDYDLLIVPGGNGSRTLLSDADLLCWVRTIKSNPARIILSVCSGVLLLAAAGILGGKTVTTHHEVIAELQIMASNFEVVKSRFCDNGDIITAAGISAGIDASLYFVGKHCSDELAFKVKTYMEYPA